MRLSRKCAGSQKYNEGVPFRDFSDWDVSATYCSMKSWTDKQQFNEARMACWLNRIWQSLADRHFQVWLLRRPTECWLPYWVVTRLGFWLSAFLCPDECECFIEVTIILHLKWFIWFLMLFLFKHRYELPLIATEICQSGPFVFEFEPFHTRLKHPPRCLAFLLLWNCTRNKNRNDPGFVWQMYLVVLAPCGTIWDEEKKKKK